MDEYKTVLEPYTETECVTTYKEDCEYHWEIVGKEKVWAPIPGSCKKKRCNVRSAERSQRINFAGQNGAGVAFYRGKKLIILCTNLTI